MAEAKYETHEYDVVVIGAGGAGLRAAVEASAQGAKTALVCKSLLGKAHTVMAEGGIAAAMGNVYPEDNWKVHFRDTMRGGKLLNNWRMAQIHAQESPDRVLELEEWGALFDRTKEGLILQRDFGGHRYARLAHVGDRTGLEMIRTLQQHAVHKGIDVLHGVQPAAAIDRRRPHQRRVRLLARERQVHYVQMQSRGARHRRRRQSLESHVEFLGIHRRRRHHGGGCRRRSDGHGVHAVSSDRHGLATQRARHSGHRRRARRRRHIEEHQERTLHVQLHPGFLQSRDRRDL